MFSRWRISTAHNCEPFAAVIIAFGNFRHCSADKFVLGVKCIRRIQISNFLIGLAFISHRCAHVLLHKTDTVYFNSGWRIIACEEIVICRTNVSIKTLTTTLTLDRDGCYSNSIVQISSRFVFSNILSDVDNYLESFPDNVSLPFSFFTDNDIISSLNSTTRS